MQRDKLKSFANEKYLNLESYRKSGQPVRTPLWFAEQDGVLYAYTVAETPKVRRIRHNPRVRVAPCDLRGNVTGEWVEARARILEPAQMQFCQRLLTQKYGLLKRLADFFARFRKRGRAGIAIEAG